MKPKYSNQLLAGLWQLFFCTPPTGLLISCNLNPCVTDRKVWVIQPAGTTLNVIKHIWVRGWECGEYMEYRVEKMEDLPKLLELVKEIDVKYVKFGVSDEFFLNEIFKV